MHCDKLLFYICVSNKKPYRAYVVMLLYSTVNKSSMSMSYHKSSARTRRIRVQERRYNSRAVENVFEQIFEHKDEVGEQDILNNLFDDEPVMDEIEDVIFNSEITEEEILREVRTLKEDKSAGPNGIVSSLFIHCIELLQPIMYKLFNRLFHEANFLRTGVGL